MSLYTWCNPSMATGICTMNVVLMFFNVGAIKAISFFLFLSRYNNTILKHPWSRASLLDLPTSCSCYMLLCRSLSWQKQKRIALYDNFAKKKWRQKTPYRTKQQPEIDPKTYVSGEKLTSVRTKFQVAMDHPSTHLRYLDKCNKGNRGRYLGTFPPSTTVVVFSQGKPGEIV